MQPGLHLAGDSVGWVEPSVVYIGTPKYILLLICASLGLQPQSAVRSAVEQEAAVHLHISWHLVYPQVQTVGCTFAWQGLAFECNYAAFLKQAAPEPHDFLRLLRVINTSCCWQQLPALC